MPESILTVLKLLLLALLYLFFLRVLRAVWAETAAGDRSTVTAVATSRVSRPAARPAAVAAAATAARLKVLAPPSERGRVYDLADELTVGRAAGCQVSLADDSTVSQLHARIWRSEEGRLMVEDLGSTNGTFLNRKKLTGAQPLRPGDRLQVGQTVLELAK